MFKFEIGDIVHRICSVGGPFPFQVLRRVYMESAKYEDDSPVKGVVSYGLRPATQGGAGAPLVEFFEQELESEEEARERLDAMRLAAIEAEKAKVGAD